MTNQELFIMANDALLKSISLISHDQWDLPMPPEMSSSSGSLRDAVRYHTYDDAWVPDVLAGKTKEEVGDTYEYLKSVEEPLENYIKYNHIASNTVQNFTDLDKVTHLSYGDYPAREYVQHIITFRAFRSYDIAKLIGANTTMDPSFVQALLVEYSPVIEGYRQMGVFPPALVVDVDATLQAKLLAMVGRS